MIYISNNIATFVSNDAIFDIMMLVVFVDFEFRMYNLEVQNTKSENKDKRNISKMAWLGQKRYSVVADI